MLPTATKLGVIFSDCGLFHNSIVTTGLKKSETSES